ncbi:MAG: AsmA family protein [Rhodospirillaceae bacterium]|nr:AsmA family protein [Rhodospirillaceae bacterium]
MKALKIIAGIVIVLIVGVVIVLLTVDVGKYKGVIQDQAKAVTGREVTIGDIKLALSLSPAIVVTDVKVANAPWGSRPEMLTLQRLEASTQLIPLLFGTVNISNLKLVGPDAVLETNAQGKGNWEFETAAAASDAPPGEGGSLPLNVSGVSVEGLKLVYKDGQTKGGANLAAKAIDVDIDGALTDMIVPSIDLDDVSGAYKDGGMAADGTVKKLSLKTVGPITDVNITKLSLSDAKGSFKDGASSYSGDVASLEMEGEGAARARPKDGKIDIAAAIKALTLTKLTIDNAKVASKDAKTEANAEIGKIAVDAKGRLADMGITNLSITNTKATYKAGGAPMDVAVDTLSLDEKGALTFVAKVSGQDLKANGTLAPLSALMGKGKSFPAKLALEGFGLKGDTDVIVDMSGKRPSAKGSITIPELDLAAYTKGADGKAAAAPPAKAGERMFSDDPLPWDQLNAADAKVNLSVGKLTLPNGVVLTNVSAPVDLANGKLAIKPASFNVAGGTLSTEVDADANAKSFALKADAKNITAETIAKELKKSDLITNGPIDLVVNVRGSGNSAHAVAGSLNGSVMVGMGESRIRSDAMNFIGGDILMNVMNAVNPMGNKDPYTVARCGVVNLQITNGVGRTNEGIALVTDKMQLTSTGQIDFGNERIDLNVRPKATGGLGIGLGSLAQAVKVQGPLAAPGIGIDKAGAIKSLGTLGAAFATGGASLLAQSAADKAAGAGGDPCQIARTWHLKK